MCSAGGTTTTGDTKTSSASSPGLNNWWSRFLFLQPPPPSSSAGNRPPPPQPTRPKKRQQSHHRRRHEDIVRKLLTELNLREPITSNTTSSYSERLKRVALISNDPDSGTLFAPSSSSSLYLVKFLFILKKNKKKYSPYCYYSSDFSKSFLNYFISHSRIAYYTRNSTTYLKYMYSYNIHVSYGALDVQGPFRVPFMLYIGQLGQI